MNEIYQNYLSTLYNFFIPQHKCIKVERVGSKYRRKFDSPKTPYQRLLDSDCLSMHEKENLKRTYESLNPVELRKDLNFQLKRFRRINEGTSDFRYKFSA